MATLKDIYNDIKNGWEYYYELNDGTTWGVLWVGICDRWNSPSYGKEYIYYCNYGSSAHKVNFENLKWIIHVIFGCRTANDFIKKYKKR